MKTPSDDRPAFPLARSSSRDNKVSCETLSHVDWYSTPKFEGREQFLYDADELYWDAADPNLDLDEVLGVHHKVGKGAFPAAHLFGCLPKSSSYLPPRTTMNPGREEKKRAADTAGRPRTHPSPIPHSGGIPHSGTLPHSGPIKLNTGPIISHSGTLKGPVKGRSTIPRSVAGKKKPTAYDAEEPTSPVVTCLGHVRMKHKCQKDLLNGGDKKQYCEWTWKFLKKIASQDSPRKGAKRSASNQSRAVMDHLNKVQSQKEYEQALGSNCAAGTDQSRGDRAAMLSDYATHIACDKVKKEAAARDGEAATEYTPQVPPPNSLLLMRGSRNLERESQKPGILEAKEVPSITAKGPVQRQVSLPKPPPEASIWKRRNASRPTALDIRTPVKLEIKQPCTK